MNDIRDWPLTPSQRHYFVAVVPNTDNQYRTIPALLRKIADWIDEQGMEDPKFHGLTLGVEFDGEENPHRTAILEYSGKVEGANGAR